MPETNVPRGPNSFIFIFTARKRSLRQGNIFAGVCHSVQGGGIPACIAVGLWGVSRPTPRGKVEGSGHGGSPGPHLQGSPGPHPGGSPGPHLGVSRLTPRGGIQAHTQGGLQVHTWRGVCIPACTEVDTPTAHPNPPPPWTATAVGGMHPTGMHSCFMEFSVISFQNNHTLGGSWCTPQENPGSATEYHKILVIFGDPIVFF